MRFAVLLVSFASLTACNAVLGLEERPARETQGGVGGDTMATTSSGGATGCQGADCFQDPPSGWTGPVVVSRGGAVDDLASCSDSYGTEMLALQNDLLADAVQCPCECDDPTGITCTVSVTSWDDDNCTSLLRTDTFNAVGQCVGIDGDTDSTSHPMPVADAGSASCAASAGTPVIPEATWGQLLRACGPVDGLEGTPTGFDVCIHRDGDVSCPADHYTERSVWYGGLDDTRACMDDCACGPVTDAQCDASVISWHNDDCTEGPPAATPVAPGCITGTYDSARLDSVTASGSCAPGTATMTGELAPTDPTTVCCHRPAS